MPSSSRVHAYGHRRTRHIISAARVPPGLDATGQWPHARESPLMQEERALGARHIFRTAAIQDQITMAREFMVTASQLVQRHQYRAWNPWFRLCTCPGPHVDQQRRLIRLEFLRQLLDRDTRNQTELSTTGHR